LHCYLRSILPLHCQLSRERFARGVAGKNAHEHAQRLVAMISRHWKVVSGTDLHVRH